jgi:hypothetical protein
MTMQFIGKPTVIIGGGGGSDDVAKYLEMQKDAALYRWLLEQDMDIFNNSTGEVFVCGPLKEALSEAITKAMEAECQPSA